MASAVLHVEEESMPCSGHRNFFCLLDHMKSSFPPQAYTRWLFLHGPPPLTPSHIPTVLHPGFHFILHNLSYMSLLHSHSLTSHYIFDWIPLLCFFLVSHKFPEGTYHNLKLHVVWSLVWYLLLTLTSTPSAYSVCSQVLEVTSSSPELCIKRLAYFLAHDRR